MSSLFRHYSLEHRLQEGLLQLGSVQRGFDYAREHKREKFSECDHTWPADRGEARGGPVVRQPQAVEFKGQQINILSEKIGFSALNKF